MRSNPHALPVYVLRCTLCHSTPIIQLLGSQRCYFGNRVLLSLLLILCSYPLRSATQSLSWKNLTVSLCMFWYCSSFLRSKWPLSKWNDYFFATPHLCCSVRSNSTTQFLVVNVCISYPPVMSMVKVTFIIESAILAVMCGKPSQRPVRRLATPPPPF